MAKHHQDPKNVHMETQDTQGKTEAKVTENQDHTEEKINASEPIPPDHELPETDGKSLPDAEQLAIELEERKQELAQAKGDLVRLLADFDNFRKRNAKERVELIQFASSDVMKSLLPALDDFQRTLIAIDKTDNLSSIRDGIAMVSDNLKKILEKQGLSPIESVGKPFDSSMHEAIGSLDVAADKKGIVLEEVERGYLLNGKVIRYSKVIVGE